MQSVAESMGLVRRVALEIAQRVPHADYDELVSAGTLGLVRAAERFDAGRGLAFSTYAVALIRGAILDELRSQSWNTRTARAKSRRLRTAVHELTGRLGRAPSAGEIAAHLEISVATYWEWQRAAESCLVERFGRLPAASAAVYALEDRLSDPAAVSADEAVEWAETLQELHGAVAALPESQRRVIGMYYGEQLTQREIGERLGVSEGRVSQIRSAALRALRASLLSEGLAAPAGEPRDDGQAAAGGRRVERAPRSLEQQA